MEKLEELRRRILHLLMPIEMLPFDTDYQRGQIDMAKTIIQLINITEGK